MRFAICNELFEGWDHRRVVEFVADAGYDGLELAPFTFADHVDEVTPARRAEIRRIAEDRGLAITGLHWLLVKPAGLHLLHPEAAVRTRTVDYLRALIDFCADVGGTNLVFGSPNQRSLVEGVRPDDAWLWAREGFYACGEAAAARGVTLCLEALPEDLTNFLNTNAEVIDLVRAIAHPNVRMMIDVKSMCAEAMSIEDNIHACRGWFRHVHANDANLLGPGFGDVDFVPIFAALREQAYEGFVSVEVFDFKPGPEAIATKSLAYMKECLEGGGAA